ncbi:MAG TPA: hypothetical protein VF879_00640 [Nitrospirales bacterium]|jgi:hypothetical protein
MAEKIKILAAAGAGALGIVNHLLPVVEGFTRLATIRVFEIAYRLYSLPL